MNAGRVYGLRCKRLNNSLLPMLAYLATCVTTMPNDFAQIVVIFHLFRNHLQSIQERNNGLVKILSCNDEIQTATFSFCF